MTEYVSNLIVEPNGGAITVKVTSEMTIYTASVLLQDVKQQLDALEHGVTIEIDLSEVSEMDTAGAQLLLMAVRIAAGKGAGLRILSMSDAVKDSLKLLGLYCRFLTAASEKPDEKSVG